MSAPSTYGLCTASFVTDVTVANVLSSLPIGLSVALLLTPVVRLLARKLGAVDHPGERRVHDRVVPRLGGVAVYSAFWLGFFGLSLSSGLGSSDRAMLSGFAMGSVILFMVGVYDDLKDAPAGLRFCIQFAVAHLAYVSGFRFFLIGELFSGFAPTAVISLLDYVLTLFWIVGIVNAVNFMDGLDFLCAGMSLTATVSLAIISAVSGQTVFVPLYLLLIGVLLGFGFFNRPPASIFLGDSGSTFLGFFLACFSLHQSHLASGGTGAVFIPFVLLVVPLFDTLYAIVRRLYLGVSPFSADRGHLHHRLLVEFGDARMAVCSICVATGVAGLTGVGLSRAAPLWSGLLLCCLALALGWTIRRLGLFDPDVMRAGRCNETCQPLGPLMSRNDQSGAGVPGDCR